MHAGVCSMMHKIPCAREDAYASQKNKNKHSLAPQSSLPVQQILCHVAIVINPEQSHHFFPPRSLIPYVDHFLTVSLLAFFGQPPLPGAFVSEILY